MNYSNTKNWQAFTADFMANAPTALRHGAQSQITSDGAGHYLLDGKRLTASELCEMPLPKELEALRQDAELFHVCIIKYRMQSGPSTIC